jgi:hypothetical protein
MHEDPQAVMGTGQRPHLFKAPPITTTANIAINDSCNWDRGDKKGAQENPVMTEVAAICGQL